tara:strand:- start:483 stop:794 length:312 start_codon:yes stop_codon:yes gene_type:complete
MINTTIENLTEPSRVNNPLEGDKIKTTNTKTGLVFIASHYNPYVETQEDINDLAKLWRNEELSKTDYIVPITDHSSHSLYMTYRQELRDWTDTADFPLTKPTL